MIDNNFDLKATRKHIQIKTVFMNESIQFFWSILSKTLTTTKDNAILGCEDELKQILGSSYKMPSTQLTKESQLNLYCQIDHGGKLDDFIDDYMDDLYPILKHEISKHVWVRGDLIAYMTLDEFLMDLKERLSLPFSKPIIDYYFKENDIEDPVEMDIKQQLELYRLCCPVRL